MGTDYVTYAAAIISSDVVYRTSFEYTSSYKYNSNTLSVEPTINCVLAMRNEINQVSTIYIVHVDQPFFPYSILMPFIWILIKWIQLPKGGQPPTVQLYKGQNGWPQGVLYSELG